MSTQSDPFTIWLAHVLAVYSLLIYMAGLLIIAIPTVLKRGFGTTLPGRLRQAMVVVTLAVMVVTYLAERRFARDREEPATETKDDGAETTTDQTPGYSLYARLSMVAAAVGVAVGIYVGFALERPFVGVLFVFGAYLFVRMGYRYEERQGGQ